jgi:hypothetical protein
VESRDPEVRPRISIKDDEGETKQLPDSTAAARYHLPVGANIFVNEDVGEATEYLISKGKHLSVREGDRVQAGEPLTDGAANLAVGSTTSGRCSGRRSSRSTWSTRCRRSTGSRA